MEDQTTGEEFSSGKRLAAMVPRGDSEDFPRSLGFVQ